MKLSINEKNWNPNYIEDTPVYIIHFKNRLYYYVHLTKLAEFYKWKGHKTFQCLHKANKTSFNSPTNVGTSPT